MEGEKIFRRRSELLQKHWEEGCVCVCTRWRKRRGRLAVEQCDFCSTVTNLAQQENQFGPVCAFLAPGENPNSKARPG